MKRRSSDSGVCGDGNVVQVPVLAPRHWRALSCSRALTRGLGAVLTTPYDMAALPRPRGARLPPG